MIEIFLKGEDTLSQKKSPNQVEVLSKKMFPISERLKASQIKSYFSNLAKDVSKARLLYEKLKQNSNEYYMNEDDEYEEEEKERGYHQLIEN